MVVSLSSGFKSMKRPHLVFTVILTTAVSLVAGSLNAAIINITPSKDNTLYEYDPAEGDLSNALAFTFSPARTRSVNFDGASLPSISQDRFRPGRRSPP